MSRLRELHPDEMTQQQREVYQAILTGPRGQVAGPLAAWLYSPEFASRAQKLGEYCRYLSPLPGPLFELAILVTAREWRAEYEWFSHASKARTAGVPEAIIEAIRTGQNPTFGRDDEQVVYDIAIALHRDRHLSDPLYARGCELLGEALLVDLVGTIGYYTLIAMTINAFKVMPPEGTQLAFGEEGALR